MRFVACAIISAISGWKGLNQSYLWDILIVLWRNVLALFESFFLNRLVGKCHAKERPFLTRRQCGRRWKTSRTRENPVSLVIRFPSQLLHWRLSKNGVAAPVVPMITVSIHTVKMASTVILKSVWKKMLQTIFNYLKLHSAFQIVAFFCFRELKWKYKYCFAVSNKYWTKPVDTPVLEDALRMRPIPRMLVWNTKYSCANPNNFSLTDAHPPHIPSIAVNERARDRIASLCERAFWTQINHTNTLPSIHQRSAWEARQTSLYIVCVSRQWRQYTIAWIEIVVCQTCWRSG